LATPPVLIDQDRRIAPPSILYGPTPSGPGLCGMKRAGAVRGPGPSSYPESLSCRQGGLPETPDSSGPSGLPPPRPGRSCFSLHRTGRMAMLHGLRGRNPVTRVQSGSFPAGPASRLEGCQLSSSPAFFVARPRSYVRMEARLKAVQRVLRGVRVEEFW
jgi:hypothetical protein